jgi:hypothetical protein
MAGVVRAAMTGVEQAAMAGVMRAAMTGVEQAGTTD